MMSLEPEMTYRVRTTKPLDPTRGLPIGAVRIGRWARQRSRDRASMRSSPEPERLDADE